MPMPMSEHDPFSNCNSWMFAIAIKSLCAFTFGMLLSWLSGYTNQPSDVYEMLNECGTGYQILAIKAASTSRKIGGVRHNLGRRNRMRVRGDYGRTCQDVNKIKNYGARKINAYRVLIRMGGSIALASVNCSACVGAGCWGVFLWILEHKLDDCRMNSYVDNTQTNILIWTDFIGRMNCYGSEGPGISAKERQKIKNQNEHGMGMTSLNKTSINSALPYAAKSNADVVFIQELN